MMQEKIEPNIAEWTKVTFKGCSQSDKTEFKKSSCLLIISVGQKIHEGEKFLRTIELIDRFFHTCVIQVDDSLQRHNIKIEDNLNDQQAYLKSIMLGDEWLKRNYEIYHRLSIPYRIIRWDQWLKHQELQKHKKVVQGIYESDASYQETMHATIKKFIERYQQRRSALPFDQNVWYNACLEYLFEECAAMNLWTETGCQFEIYPSGRNLIQTMTYEKLIKPSSQTLLRSVSLYFDKRLKKQKNCMKE